MPENNVDPFARVKSRPRMLWSSRPERGELAEWAKVFVWRNVGLAWRVTLPSKEGDPARLAEPTFCCSCQRFIKFCKETYEKWTRQGGPFSGVHYLLPFFNFSEYKRGLSFETINSIFSVCLLQVTSSWVTSIFVYIHKLFIYINFIQPAAVIVEAYLVNGKQCGRIIYPIQQSLHCEERPPRAIFGSWIVSLAILLNQRVILALVKNCFIMLVLFWLSNKGFYLYSAWKPLWLSFSWLFT